MFIQQAFSRLTVIPREMLTARSLTNWRASGYVEGKVLFHPAVMGWGPPSHNGTAHTCLGWWLPYLINGISMKGAAGQCAGSSSEVPCPAKDAVA